MTAATDRERRTVPALASPSRPLVDAVEYLGLGECTVGIALQVLFDVSA